MTDYNSLYDHYKVKKLANIRLKDELQQSNQRERTFLKLLKKTEQYGEQATQLESEYDKLFTEEGLSKDPAIGGQGAVVKVNESTTLPKLDLSIIYMQQAENEDDQAQEEAQPVKAEKK